MIRIEGLYYDGQSSDQTPVVMTVEQSGTVAISGENLDIKTSIEQLKIAPRLGNTQRNIFLVDGAKLETGDNKSVDQVCSYFNKNILHSVLHRLEKNWSIVLIALLITVTFVWGGIEYGVPFASKWVVKSIPYKLEQDIGEQGLETLDNWLFSESEIESIERQNLRKQFKRLTAFSKKEYQYHLEFRTSKKMGANALALPGGIIIVTDALLKLAENDQQILAVLAHEMGHIEYQHGLRSMLQNSITALFMAGVLGDVTSLTSLSVTVPTMLVESRYSREFELEADQYAIHFLQDQQITVEQYTRILSLLEQPKNSTYEFDYLSSHPSMDKRIAIIQAE